MFLKYLTSLSLISSLLLGLIAGVNYLVDPAGIYHEGKVSPELYVNELIGSQNGLLWPEGLFSERDFAKALASLPHRQECVVIGSSHVMQISSHRLNASLQNICPSLINVGVSGASIEDHITLSYLVVQSGFTGRIVLGVAPWTLSYGKDKRWLKYRQEYSKARSEIFSYDDSQERASNDLGESGAGLLMGNLINLEYTQRSIAQFLKYGFDAPEVEKAPVFDHMIGYSVPVKLPDGSHVYSKQYIAKSGNVTKLRGENHQYKVKTSVSSGIGIKDYKRLLEWISERGINPAIVLTPYHPFAWGNNESNIYLAMMKTENIIRNIASEVGIDLYGSYNPAQVDCDESDFYDVMHAKDACLMKIVQE